LSARDLAMSQRHGALNFCRLPLGFIPSPEGRPRATTGYYSVHAPEVSALPRARRTSSTSLRGQVGIVSTPAGRALLAAGNSLAIRMTDTHCKACIDQATCHRRLLPQRLTLTGLQRHGCNTNTFKVWISGKQTGA
jgi:hypothetical protein